MERYGWVHVGMWWRNATLVVPHHPITRSPDHQITRSQHHQITSGVAHIPPMDVFNPLLGICRGVEADILNYLVHSPAFDNPTSIARKIGRSKSETLKCLHFLSDAGIITRTSGSGRLYGLERSRAAGAFLLRFGQMPRILGDDLREVCQRTFGEIEDTLNPLGLRADPSSHLSVCLAPEQWNQVMGLQNTLFLVHHERAHWNAHLLHALMKRAEERFRVKLHVLTGPPSEIRTRLMRTGIELNHWPYSLATKGPVHVWGEDLLSVLDRVP